jgi:hypothetical protein
MPVSHSNAQGYRPKDGWCLNGLSHPAEGYPPLTTNRWESHLPPMELPEPPVILFCPTQRDEAMLNTKMALQTIKLETLKQYRDQVRVSCPRWRDWVTEEIASATAVISAIAMQLAIVVQARNAGLPIALTSIHGHW